MIVALGTALWYMQKPQVFAATVITTNSSDTLTTFRTNVNTSLTNLANGLFSASSTNPFMASYMVATSSAISTFAGAIEIGPHSASCTGENKLCVVATAAWNDYFGPFVLNPTNGSVASADIVAANDNALNDATAYIDFGVNSTGNTNASFTLMGKGAGYLFTNSGLGDLVIANASSTHAIVFGSGGTLAANERMRISGNGTIGIATSTQSANQGITIATSTLVQFAQLATAYGSSTTDASIETVDWNKGNKARYILNQNTNFAINATSSHPLDGGTYILKLCQDTTGSRTATFITPGQLRWATGTTTISATANTCSMIGLIYDARSSIYNVMASSTGMQIN